MTNQTYIIRQQDRNAAVSFIDHQLDTQPDWLSEIESRRAMARQEYQQARTDPDSFNAWCHKWLNENQWIEIKQAICVARGRQEKRLRYIEPNKTISVTNEAWKILTELALKDQLSLSEVIVNRLGKNTITTTTISSSAKSRYNLAN
ncbi:hypothetical protein [Nitrosomonas sp.]|uniref:hypothetical protein n=1 Tax=Nitrosomonas sp. TaxID=42353 RepID=UPI0025D53D49|nr:hypothetical protein [Nitrosomonas sp.]MCC6916924.1 hypothetical protein [Nitrosomonas sp.]